MESVTEVSGATAATNLIPSTAVELSGMTQEEFAAKVAALPKVEAPVVPKRTKVAILGFVSHWQKAPFQDPSFEIWGLNELYQFIPRWDRWFELHARDIYENDRNRISQHIDKLKIMTNPIYMHQTWPDIPGSVRYPIEAICQAFPNPCPEARPYLTNSITMMLLLAVLEGFKEIHLYGVDMSHDCLGPDMRVLTADLCWVRAGDLAIGQELLAFDEDVPVTPEGEPAQFHKYRKTTVESLSRISRPCYRLEMTDRSTLVTSKGHQWLTPSGVFNWTRTDGLAVGDRLFRLDPITQCDFAAGELQSVISVNAIGEQEVIGIQTGTATLIVEGFASHNSEYSAQRPSCEWAVGIAQGRGIKTYLPSESDLLKTLYLYGYEQEPAVAFDRKLAVREAEMAEQINKLDAEIARLTEVRGQYRGAHQDTAHWRKNWKSMHTTSTSS